MTSTPETSIDALTLTVRAERPDLRPHAAPDGTVTLLFTDIEDSSGLDRATRRSCVGPGDAARASRADAAAGRTITAGFEVKCQGDGFMVAFRSARRALDCAVAIQRAVEADNPMHPESAIRVRIGLHPARRSRKPMTSMASRGPCGAHRE